MLKINELSRLHLGVKGENLSRTIEIDMSAWASLYPNATAEILHKRYGDETKILTGATYDSDTMILSWTPTDYDTFYEGYGLAEIRMVEANIVKKTKDLIITAVCPSVIDGSGSVVASSYQGFLDSVIGYKNGANTAKNAAEAAQTAAETAQGKAEDAADKAEYFSQYAPYIDDDTGNWMVWDVDNEQYVDTGVHAQGPQGEPGSIDNVFATGIRMSTSDDTTVKDAMDGKADLVESATSGNFAALDGNGNLTDSGHKHSDYLTAHQDISGKADKVTGATSGNFAGLDGNGNLTDSGSKAGDFLTPSNIYNGVDKTASGYALDARTGKILNDSANNLRKGLMHVAKLSSGDWILSSGDNAGIGEILSVNGIVGVATAAITGGSTVLVKNTNWVEVAGGVLNKLFGDKADKVSSATSGNFAALDANGNLTDSGHKHGDYLTEHQDISGKANDNAVVHNTGTETIAGDKSFTGSTFIKNDSEAPRLSFSGKDMANHSANIFAADAETTGNKYGQVYFRFTEYSPATDGTSRTSWTERYDLPKVDAGRESHARYDILTTKTAPNIIRLPNIGTGDVVTISTSSSLRSFLFVGGNNTGVKGIVNLATSSTGNPSYLGMAGDTSALSYNTATSNQFKITFANPAVCALMILNGSATVSVGST